MLKNQKLRLSFRNTTTNLSNNSTRSKVSMKEKSKDLKREFKMKNQELIRRCNKLLRITKTSFKRCQTTMRMLIMLFKTRKMQLKLICKTSLLSLKKRIRLCSSRLKLKTSISRNWKDLMRTCRIIQASRMIKLMKNLPRKEENWQKRLNNQQLKSQREKGQSPALKILRKVLLVKFKTKRE